MGHRPEKKCPPNRNGRSRRETAEARPAQVGPAKSGAVKKWLLAASLLAAVLFAYLPATRCGYVWDDDALLTDHAVVLTGAWRDIWTPGKTLQFLPMVFSSYAIEHKLWGLNPFGYHLVNILLHAGNTVLLWLILRRLSIPGALMAAFLFGLHPVHVESVAWLTERKNVLSGLFYLASILTYLGFAFRSSAKDHHAWHPGTYALAFLFFFLALLSKTVTCSMPAVILLILWWKRGRITRGDVMPLLPFFTLGAALGLLTAWMEKNLVLAKGSEWDLSFLDRCLIAARALWFYAGKLLWPTDLAFIYPRWVIDAAVWWQWLFPVGGLLLVAALMALHRRLGRGPLVAVLFFAGTLFPALGFIDTYPMRYSFVADHFQYLASIGMIVLAVCAARALVTRLAVRAATVRAVSAGVLVTLTVLTWRQCRAYKDEETLWNDVIRKNRECWMAHYNLGNLLAVSGRVDEAITHYQRSADIKPDNPDAHNNLASVLVARQRYDEAIAEYRKALEIDPDQAEAHYNLATVLVGLGQTDDALAHCQAALKAKPDYAKANYRIGVILAGRGQSDDAIRYLHRALKLATRQRLDTLAESARSQIKLCEAAASSRVHQGEGQGENP